MRSCSDCEVTISWGRAGDSMSTCGILAHRSEKWLGGTLKISGHAELAEPTVACTPLDNPNEPNEASWLRVGNFSWAVGQYSPPDEHGQRFRSVRCTSAEGVTLPDSLCLDEKANPTSWQPASSTTSRPLTRKVALIRRGDCTFLKKATLAQLAGAAAAGPPCGIQRCTATTAGASRRDGDFCGGCLQL
jgi:hypothetical protein